MPGPRQAQNGTTTCVAGIATGIRVFCIAGLNLETMQDPFHHVFWLTCTPRAARGDTEIARTPVTHSGTYVDFISPINNDVHLARRLRAHGPGPSGIDLQVHHLDKALGCANTHGIGHQTRSSDAAGSWQAANLNAEVLMGLPITSVKSHSGENAWEHDA